MPYSVIHVVCGSTENVTQVGMYGFRHFNIVHVNSVSLKS